MEHIMMIKIRIQPAEGFCDIICEVGQHWCVIHPLGIPTDLYPHAGRGLHVGTSPYTRRVLDKLNRLQIP